MPALALPVIHGLARMGGRTGQERARTTGGKQVPAAQATEESTKVGPPRRIAAQLANGLLADGLLPEGLLADGLLADGLLADGSLTAGTRRASLQ